MLQSKDIIFVPPTEIVKWNRTISLLLPQTDLFKSYNPIINNGLQTYEEPQDFLFKIKNIRNKI